MTRLKLSVASIVQSEEMQRIGFVLSLERALQNIYRSIKVVLGRASRSLVN